MRKLNAILLSYLLLLVLAQPSGTQTPAITYATSPNASDCNAERANWSAHVAQTGATYYCNGTSWTAWSSSLPSGGVIMVMSGSCPATFTEVTALDAAMPEGTLAAHGDVGGTGGANTVTPTVASLTAAAQTFIGSSATTSSVSGGTPAGTNAWPASVPTFSGSALATHSHGAGTLADATSGSTVKLFTSSASGVSAATLSGSTAAVSAGTPAGTIAWPVSVPTFLGSALAGHTHTLTAAGTNGTSAVTGTLNSFDNRPAYVKVIYCQKS